MVGSTAETPAAATDEETSPSAATDEKTPPAAAAVSTEETKQEMVGELGKEEIYYSITVYKKSSDSTKHHERLDHIKQYLSTPDDENVSTYLTSNFNGKNIELYKEILSGGENSLWTFNESHSLSTFVFNVTHIFNEINKSASTNTSPSISDLYLYLATLNMYVADSKSVTANSPNMYNSPLPASTSGGGDSRGSKKSKTMKSRKLRNKTQKSTSG